MIIIIWIYYKSQKRNLNRKKIIHQTQQGHSVPSTERNQYIWFYLFI